MKRDLVLFEELDAPHHFIVGPFALPVLAVLVVDVGGPIDADADAAVVLQEKLAPGIVDESAIRLKIMDDLALGDAPSRHQPERFFVISERNRQRLAGVPDYAQLAADQAAFENSVERFVQHL